MGNARTQCSSVSDAHSGALSREGARGSVDACGSAPRGPEGSHPGRAGPTRAKPAFNSWPPEAPCSSKPHPRGPRLPLLPPHQ